MSNSNSANLRIARPPEASRIVGLSKSTILRLAEAKQFPQPVKLTERTYGFLVSDLEAWIAKKVEESGKGVTNG